MFPSSARQTMYSPAMTFARTYFAHGIAARVAGSDPHELIVLLFEALDRALLQAKGAIEQGELTAKATAIDHALRILDDGLRTALSPDGGELTDNLSRLYDYCLRRLAEANLRSDASIIDEVRGLLEPVAEAWNQIRPQ